MNIRPANSDDVLPIVDLLKASLGESLVPKSMAYWQWKHQKNPFGNSPVMVAEHNGKLVGIRAFMQWRWTNDKKIYKALRAVDTATHPNYHSRGIFSKLTSTLVEKCKHDGFDFIFNTPNDKSRPGYLKLGWHVVGRLPISISAQLCSLASSRPETPSGIYSMKKILEDMTLDGFLNDLQFNKLHTPYDRSYLAWRYLDVPIATYHAVGNFSGNGKFLFIFRVKENRFMRELRIVELLGEIKNNKAMFRKEVGDVISIIRPGVISWSSLTSHNRLFPTLFLKGPIVTLRSLNNLISFENWAPSLGDLELF